MTISVYPESPEPEDLIKTAVEAFQGEYKELDVYPIDAEVCGRPTEARDLDFVCLDLVSSVFLRSFRTNGGTVFILCQTDTDESEEMRAVFDAILTGMTCDEEDDQPFPFGGFNMN